MPKTKKKPDRPAADPVWVGVEEAAARLGVSPWWIRRHVQSRTIPFSKFGGWLRFDLNKLDAWAEEHSYEPEEG